MPDEQIGVDGRLGPDVVGGQVGDQAGGAVGGPGDEGEGGRGVNVHKITLLTVIF